MFALRQSRRGEPDDYHRRSAARSAMFVASDSSPTRACERTAWLSLVLRDWQSAPPGAKHRVAWATLSPDVREPSCNVQLLAGRGLADVETQMKTYPSLGGAWLAIVLTLAGGCADVDRQTAKPVSGDHDDDEHDDEGGDEVEPDDDESADPDDSDAPAAERDAGSSPGRDAGSRDAAASDASARDAGTASDAGRSDAGASDASQPQRDAAVSSDSGSTPTDAGNPADTGTDAAAPPAGEDECGPIPTTLTADTTGKRSNSFGFTEIDVRSPNQMVRLQTRLTVPAKPPANGTVFLWPGLQPLDGKNFLPIGNGVLQPVLTWGPSCAPGTLLDHSSWWISGQYVNVYGNAGEYRGCKGGKVLRVDPGDVLAIDMVLKGTEWTQIVTSTKSGKSVDFTIDLKGQEQGRAIFDIELPTANKPTEDVLFTSTVLTYTTPLTRACAPVSQGATDYVSKARLSKDGLHCCVDRMALRAKGVAATTRP